jgi:hypothetical protein
MKERCVREWTENLAKIKAAVTGGDVRWLRRGKTLSVRFHNPLVRNIGGYVEWEKLSEHTIRVIIGVIFGMHDYYINVYPDRSRCYNLV